MEIIYPGIKKGADAQSFMLLNGLGYLWLSNVPESRYQGFFFMDNLRMFKVIDNIELSHPVDEIKNSLSGIERKRGKITEKFSLAKNSLIYELNNKTEFDVVLDCRESYDNAQMGRFYEISESRGKIIIKFTKKNLEDDTEDYAIYLVIKTDGEYGLLKEWIPRHYSLDEKRNSPPFSRYVYRAIKLNCKKAIFSVSCDKNEAVKEVNITKAKNIKLINKFKNKEINIAYNCAVNSLNNLIFANNISGIFAGFPWFFQFWTRDELISCKAIGLIGKSDFAKKLLISQLNGITFDGKMFDKYPTGGMKNVDSAGWLFMRLSELNLNAKEREMVKDKLEFCIDGIAKNHLEEGLVKNKPLETWMDTDFNGDNRGGFRIEIQAIQLFFYKYLYKLTKEEKYRKKELRLKKKVRQKFWNGKWLADGLNDYTIRPNVFIAAYFYPELLTRWEWKRCFERILPKLWLEWGGLSTIDTNHHLFTDEHTGENNRSYHRGDSWFWLNNLAAIVMHRVDKKEFKDYTEKILQAGTKDILFNGAIGCASELSSAKEQRAEGCLNQAWSNAMYIEMVEELY